MNALEKISQLKSYQNSKLIGQEHLTNALLVAMLCEGHLLIEGLPGVAKTRAVNSFAKCMSSGFGRVQFTPDMLPSDITGNDIYDPKTTTFNFCKGPLFANIILADEINRAPAKVQSALLEAMQESQVTVNGKTHQLPSPFMVMATQNPQDQEGTYTLPEAQKDRFLMNIVLSYPSEAEELQILQLVRNENSNTETKEISYCTQQNLKQAKEEIAKIHVSDVIEQYIVRIVHATRPENQHKITPTLQGIITYGAGPRATLALEKCARATAWLLGRNYVTGDDVRNITKDVLRHRVKLSLKAIHEGWTMDKVLDELLLNTSIG
jgi:MoxR-like ATPase